MKGGTSDEKSLILVCLLVLVVGVVFSAVPMADAAGSTYRVGYARINITPYYTEGDIYSGVMPLPLRGYGDVWNRPSIYVSDDNGDGYVDENDGLFLTCIAITDSNDETVLLYTIDMIGMPNPDEFRKAITERLGDQVEASNIMLSGTHTHSAPDVTVYDADGVSSGYVYKNGYYFSYYEMNRNLGIWIDRTLENAADAAQLAMADRAPVTVRKGQLSAAQSDTVDGRTMLSVRHYINEAGGCVAGDNFNDRGSDPKAVSEVNDNMYMLEFVYGKNSGKENIVLANWRGHPSLNGADNKYTISSDYVNAFRSRIEENGYRVAFFQGAGGNVNPRGFEETYGVPAYDWIDNFGTNYRANGYGKVLGNMGLECLENCMQDVDSTGDIETRQITLTVPFNDSGLSDLAYDAAEWYHARYSNGLHVYTSDSGEKYVIGSSYQANSILSRWDRANSKLAITTKPALELNTIKIGSQIAFVTVPGEPYDRYSTEATLETINDYNDWDKLTGEALGLDHGTPFVMGYCNGSYSYIPNSLAYTYNAGSEKWVTGSYETHVSRVSQGTGERMMDVFAMLLTGGEDGHEAYCEACNETVIWHPMGGGLNVGAQVNGHFYLTENVDGPQILVDDGRKLCLDLNGYSYTGATRCVYVYANHTANIFDNSAAKTGKMIGRGNPTSSLFTGGTLYVAANATLNIYGGTYTTVPTTSKLVKNGGVGMIKGVVNMYDGLITGGYTEEDGGTLYIVQPDGYFNMYGGKVESGKSGKNTSNCVYTSGKVQLSGDACIDQIYFIANSSSTTPKVKNWLTVKDTYTGTVELSFKDTTVKVGTDVGDTKNANMDRANITIAGKDWFVMASGSNLVVSDQVQAQLVTDGETVVYNTLQNALTAAQKKAGSYVQLLREIPQTTAVTVAKDAYFDLNGYDVWGSITVAEGATLYCMDSVTDDYEGVGYGALLGELAGDIQAVPENTVSAKESDSDYHAGYFAVRDEDGAMSFHRVDLRLRTVSLRAYCAGIYYSGNFRSDEIVASMVEEYGIALSLVEVPTEENVENCLYSVYTDFVEGKEGNASHGMLLQNILKESRSDEQNLIYGQLPIYGRAYIKVDGQYIYGDPAAYSLIELLKVADMQFDDLSMAQSNQVLELYDIFYNVTSQWDLPNIRRYY